MSGWNYRITRERVTEPDGSTPRLYSVREVFYDDDGSVRAWSKEPTTFVGDTPGEVMESLLRASQSWSAGVLDLETRQTVRVTYHGREVPRR